MSIDNNTFDPKKDKIVIDAVNYNGKYVDVRIVKKRILSVTAILAALACACVIILF